MNHVQKGTSETLVALDIAYAAKIGGGTIAGVEEMHLLDAGALAIFDQDNNLIASTDVAADLTGVTGFYIAQGMPSALHNPRKSILIDRKAAKWNRIAYKAPVLQISKFGKIATVGSSGFPTTPLDNTICSVIITDTSGGVVLPNRQTRIEVPVYSTDTTSTLSARLIAAIEASGANELVTVTYTTGASDDYYTFTGKDAEKSFTVGWDDVLKNISVKAFDTVGQLNGFAGVGTAAQVVRMLSEGAISHGDAFRTELRRGAFGPGWWGITEPVGDGSGLTFDLIAITWETEVKASVALNHISNPVVYVAEEVGGTGNTALNTLFGILYAYADSVALPVDGNVPAYGFTYA